MKKAKIWLVALALLVLLAGTARAEMYVEGYLGGNFGANSPGSTSLAIQIFPGPITSDYPGHIDPAFMGGLKLGAWFEQSGVLAGVNFPAWMKYLGFYLDFSYHRLDFPPRTAGVLWYPVVGAGVFPDPYNLRSEGGAATLAFMFAFRYGFFPDKEVPFGRLQPYLAVGPALLFTWQQPKLGDNTDLASQSSTNLALAVEAGLRWMCLKNVSLDLAFKYRYAQPRFSYEFMGGLGSFRFTPTYNLFSVILGAAYHF